MHRATACSSTFNFNDDQIVRVAIEASGAAVAIADSDGRHVYHNRAFTQLFGYRIEELTEPAAPMALYADPKCRRSVVANVMQGQFWQGEIEMVAKDGRHFPVELRADPIRNESGQVVALIGVHTDITRKKATECRLRQLSRAVEQAVGAVIITDLQGNIEYVNPKFVETAGFSPEEALGQNLRMLQSGSTTPDVYTQLWQTILSGRVWQGELHNRRKNGELYWASATISPITTDDHVVSHFVAVMEDITARKLAHDALAESEERFRTLFELAPDGIYLIDPEGNFVDGNAAAQELIGYPKAEMTGKSFLTLNVLGQSDFQRAAANLARNAQGEPTGPEEYLLNRKDGQQVSVGIRTFPVRIANQTFVLGVARDVTDRRRAEEQLRQSEQRFRLIAETIDEVFWIADANIEKTFYVSPAFEKIWGRSCKAFLQDPSSFLDTVHPEDRDRVHACLQLHAGGKIFSHEYRIIRPDGSIRWISDHGLPVRDAVGKVTSYVGVARDATERKSLREQFLQAQKMEAVGRLACGVAHDFNNLLMVINGHGELILRHLDFLDPLREPISSIIEAGLRAAGLTGQLLAFSRKQITRPRVLDLNAVIRQATNILRRLIGEDIILTTTLQTRLGMVMADSGQIDQVLMNLAVNARDAMPGGGELLIETANVDLDATYALAHVEIQAGPYVQMTVSDSGVGMTEEIQSHLFEPFFTTKQAGEGTGLGLATVFGVVKQAGGSIWVYSEPDKGTTFKIYLPRVQESAELEPARPSRGTLQGSETILLVEDQTALRKMARTALGSLGYQVLEAATGQEALLVAERTTGPIHLLLTDVVMPGMSGGQLASRLQPLRPEMKVLFMSGYAQNMIANRGVLEAGVAYLPKPATPDDLAAKVREVLSLPRPLRIV